MALNILLAWVFGLVVLWFIWRQSLPARDFPMTAIAALSLIAAAIAAYASARVMWLRMRQPDAPGAEKVLGEEPLILSLILFAPLFVIFSHNRTAEPTDWFDLADLDMPGEALVEKPAGWLPYQIARDNFLAVWCRREAPTFEKDVEQGTSRPAKFEDEWKTRRNASISDLTKPFWHGERRRKPDLRYADLMGAFLSGANLRRAHLESAVLIEAQLERAILSDTQMAETVLSFAHMEGAELWDAQMTRANLIGTILSRADLRSAQMESAILIDAQMERVILRRAQMKGTILNRAQMKRAILSYSLLTGTDESVNLLYSTNLSAVTNHGGALRFVDLREIIVDARTDFRNAFLDGSVHLPVGFAEQMGHPCQWVTESLSDEEFYGRWRGWLEMDRAGTPWVFLAPPEYRDIPAIPPPGGCVWQTGPMPGAEGVAD